MFARASPLVGKAWLGLAIVYVNVAPAARSPEGEAWRSSQSARTTTLCSSSKYMPRSVVTTLEERRDETREYPSGEVLLPAAKVAEREGFEQWEDLHYSSQTFVVYDFM